jgi:hypothetical protein
MNDEIDGIERAIEQLEPLLPGSVPEAVRNSVVIAVCAGIFGIIGDAFRIPREFLEQLRLDTAQRGELRRQERERAAQEVAGTGIMARARLVDGQRAIRQQSNREELAVRILAEAGSERWDTSDEAAVPTSNWLSCYWSEGAEIDDEDVRAAFARIMLGEVTRPGSVSVATVRLVADLDREMADRFRRAVSCTWLSVDPSGDLPWIVHPAPYAFLDYGDSTTMGLDHDDLTRLDAAGLITSWRIATINMSQGLEPVEYSIGGCKFLVDLSGRQLKVIYLSNVGEELARLIDIEPNDEYVRAFEWLVPEMTE